MNKNWQPGTIRILNTVLFFAIMLAALGAWRTYRVLNAPAPAAIPATVTRTAREAIEFTDVHQSIWRVPERSAVAGGPFADRFRLAGTFFLYGEESNTALSRRAIIDDISAGEQRLVGEGDDMNGVSVVRVDEDRVLLREGAREGEIFLSFVSGPDTTETSGGESAAPASGDEVVLETSRFGKRVGPTRWVLQREEMLEYYQELLDDPERIAALFTSLKPDYDAENNIAGYEVDVVGEKEFFESMGLEPGDKVRKVNSMNMVSQKRAEYFISEFIQNRVNAFVIDIEREGKPEKMIYLVR